MKNKIKYLTQFVTLFVLFIIPATSLAVPTTPSNISPADQATNVSLNPTLQASDITKTKTQWQIADAVSLAPGNIVWDTGEKVGNINTIIVSSANGSFLNALLGKSQLDAGKVYYWHVKYGDDNGWGGYSATTAFTTTLAPTGGAEVFLGDDCSSISENICTPAKNLICVACVNKTGIKCNDPEGNVCLGAVGYTGETGELAEELTPCDVGRDGSGVTEKVVNNIACDAGLICQNKQCINDYGGQALTGLGIGKASTDLRDQIRSFINIALGFLGVAGAIIVLYGGVLWMTARGNDEQVTKAKSTIVSGVIGIIIILLAWTIVSYVLKLGQQVTT